MKQLQLPLTYKQEAKPAKWAKMKPLLEKIRPLATELGRDLLLWAASNPDKVAELLSKITPVVFLFFFYRLKKWARPGHLPWVAGPEFWVLRPTGLRPVDL